MHVAKCSTKSRLEARTSEVGINTICVVVPSFPLVALRRASPAVRTTTKAAYHDLYWSVGDSGNQEDPENNSQETTNHLGSMIRISVPSDGAGFEIPSGNLPSESLCFGCGHDLPP